jgi:hypothetical protein
LTRFTPRSYIGRRTPSDHPQVVGPIASVGARSGPIFKGGLAVTPKPRIAHFSGPNATIQNSPPLVTSNKARAKYGLPLAANLDKSAARFDVLRAQRLAKPVTVYVDQFSAHPLEQDAAELYGPPDGYLDRDGRFHKERSSPADKPVYEIELFPEDGVYPLPYMARQADGRPWEEECAEPLAPASRARQAFYPDGSRPARHRRER